MPKRAHRVRSVGVAAITGTLLSAGLVAAPATAAPSDRGCESRTNNTYAKLLECVRVEGVREHQAALQAIADAHEGNRAENTPGYTASVDYVLEVLSDTRWQAEAVPFEYPGIDVSLSQLEPTEGDYLTATFTGTGEGDVTGSIIPVDLVLTGDRANTSGCEAGDFTDLDWSGDNDIALIQRGGCSFGVKALNAENEGAEALIIFNQGDSEGRRGLIGGRLGEPGQANVVGIPVVDAAFATGEALAEAATARVFVDFVTRTSYNVIAELPGATDDNIVMAGAHLDSVLAGPGINDNGSGTGALLEIAEQMSQSRPQNTVRFGWWGAEEIGLVGSTQWVEQRSQAEVEQVALYLNFDMIGSPNYVFQVYDADESTFEAPVPVPEGSEQIEELFESFYTWRGEPYDDSAFSGRSDYQAFINEGIPSSGLFTGAEEVKTDEQAQIWGGTAGEKYDPCYHLACDTFDNNSDTALEVNSDAVAFAVLTYAASTESVNGVKGATIPGRFRLPEPAGPQGTFGG